MKNNIVYIVMKKELTDLFRDKKTFLMAILIPLVMFPLLFGIMGRVINKTENDLKKETKIAITEKQESNLSKFIKKQQGIKVIESSDAEKDIKEGKIYLAIKIPDDFDKSIVKENNPEIEIIYDNSSQNSLSTYSAIKGYIEQYSKVIVGERLEKRGINITILNPVKITEKTTEKEDSGTGKFMLSLMLPLLIVLYSVTGPLPAATDLGAGEKERGTLEPLLTTKAGRMSLLWGKFLAITLMGLITNIATIIGLIFASKQPGSILTLGGGSYSISVGIIILIGVFALLTTMVFGAIELSISIYARSFKEASTYLSPLTIIAMVPTYATYMLDAKNISLIYFNIPLSNVVCIIKEFIAGIYNPVHIGLTTVWTIAYIFGSILFDRFMCSREEVIFRT
ncbi:MAG: ABC transporter permease [Bacillota bacterium]|nr:ABC transporter permease [Bacillota bacterium]